MSDGDSAASAPAKPAGKRLFLAVNLSVQSTRRVGEVVERLRRAGAGPRVAWVPPPNLHVTLKFLGWTRTEAVGAIAPALAQVIEARRPFEIEAGGAGAFPSVDAPKVLWIGVRDPSGALAELAAQVDARMERLGYQKEARAFHPHVTIGRVKDAGSCAAMLAPYEAQGFGMTSVREVILYESRLRSTGSEYEVVTRMTLGGTPKTTERQTRSVEGTPIQQEPDTHGGAD